MTQNEKSFGLILILVATALNPAQSIAAAQPKDVFGTPAPSAPAAAPTSAAASALPRISGGGAMSQFSTPGDQRPVTLQQFKEMVRVLKRSVDRFDKMEAQIKSGTLITTPSAVPKTTGSEEAVDLNAMLAADTAPAASNAKTTHGGMGATEAPNFKTYFDFNLVNRPGVENLSFDSFHTLLFFELMVSPEIQFSFDVSASPRYFELDYQLTPRLQVRWGKIWIPFDDMSPHNIFGGRVNVSRLAVSGAQAFLPDIWTDLGVGLKYQLVDRPKFTLVAHAYMVNGFRDGGKDPVNSGASYPSLSDPAIGADNNRDKALGGRLQSTIFGKLSLGASYYTARWSPDSTPAYRMSILGLDTQLRFPRTELRLGLASMSFHLPSSAVANRGGYYAEIAQKLGANKNWKALLRVGALQMDDRALDTNATTPLGDQQIVGGTLVWKPNAIQYSLETSRDLKIAPSKANYSFTSFRIVMAL